MDGALHFHFSTYPFMSSSFYFSAISAQESFLLLSGGASSCTSLNSFTRGTFDCFCGVVLPLFCGVLGEEPDKRSAVNGESRDDLEGEEVAAA